MKVRVGTGFPWLHGVCIYLFHSFWIVYLHNIFDLTLCSICKLCFSELLASTVDALLGFFVVTKEKNLVTDGKLTSTWYFHSLAALKAIYTPPAFCALLRPQNYGIMMVIQVAFAPALLNLGSLGELQKQREQPGEELVQSSLSTSLNHYKSLPAAWHRRIQVLIFCPLVSISNIGSHLLSWNYTGFSTEKNNRKCCKG